MKTNKFIPETGFNVVDNTTKTETAVTMFNDCGTINLSLFSIIQLVEGAKILVNNIKSELVAKQLVLTYMMLGNSMFDNDVSSGNVCISVDRTSMTYMKDFLLARMKHCEEEREARNDKFNPDTYIACKILLLEIKEWLMGEIVLVQSEDLATLADQQEELKYQQ